MSKITLTTMVMIQCPASGQVLVQNRLRSSFTGLSFPGGHVEPGESLHDCAVREVAEETGLAVRDLQFCGFKHECWRESDDAECRYFVFFYKTSAFSGTLMDTDEGQHFWSGLDELLLRKAEFTPFFEDYIPMFDGTHSEAFCTYSKPGDYDARELKYF
ncbi:MAG: NUDIX domain-containing protein [Oscillospiraceae bacterium]|nr:NUDIX domain-containing protein [Oscillospiraceae bacterium]